MQDILSQYETVKEDAVKEWFRVGKTTDFPENSGACIKYKTKQGSKEEHHGCAHHKKT